MARANLGLRCKLRLARAAPAVAPSMRVVACLCLLCITTSTYTARLISSPLVSLTLSESRRTLNDCVCNDNALARHRRLICLFEDVYSIVVADHTVETDR